METTKKTQAKSVTYAIKALKGHYETLLWSGAITAQEYEEMTKQRLEIANRILDKELGLTNTYLPIDEKGKVQPSKTEKGGN